MMFWVLPHSVDSWLDTKVSEEKNISSPEEGRNFFFEILESAEESRRRRNSGFGTTMNRG